MADVAVEYQQRLQVRVYGLVQGVGFRPFVYRAADEFGLTGFVENNDRGVDIEVEGTRSALDAFVERIEGGAPPLATVASIEVSTIAPRHDDGFRIRESERHGVATTQISPDAAICDDCLSELFDRDDRRYGYPFINCTNCGPRYTIVEGIPYDRPLTSMKGFEMCPDCRREYHDPFNRRFHAQPNACPVCGPQVAIVDRHGKRSETEHPFEMAGDILASGLILAVKGLGGFHLAVNPHDDAAVRRLRLRKGRAEKPFALMASDLEAVFRYCKITPEEEQALKHRTRPIVLLEARDGHGLAPSVAPMGVARTDPTPVSSFPELGFMLAYTPVHFLLLRGKFDALVMTSANLSEEPIAIGNEEAYERLGAIADYFLVHDRDILQRCDDSVVRVRDGAMTPIRRSRGFVPNPVNMPISTPKTILACGGELKNTVGLARGNSVFLSQHIGDLDNPYAYQFFEHSIRHLQTILEIDPDVIAYDMHPEYVSTKWALAQKNFRLIAVQHHHAHLAAVMAENGVTDRTIGIILDGTGYGTDGTIWGGEVLIGDLAGFDRFAWLRPFSLPGGAAAIRHPWRTAYAMVHEALCVESGDHAFRRDMPTARSNGRSGGPERRTAGIIPTWVEETLLPFETMQERETFKKVLRRRINTPQTSSCGRLFDGVSAILGLCREVTYEAQAAIALEMTADPDETWSFLLEEPIGRGPLDWTPILRGILGDIEMGTPVSVIATRFHRTLADLFVRAALQAREETGIDRVGLSGGVFQNKLLFCDIRTKLEREGFEVITHRLIPTNDGGIAYGQAAIAARTIRDENDLEKQRLMSPQTRRLED